MQYGRLRVCIYMLLTDPFHAFDVGGMLRAGIKVAQYVK